MMDIIKKIFAVLSNFPAFASLFKKAAQTGKVDPVEALGALSSISPSTRKCADVALNTVQRGGSIPDVARALTNVGEIEVMGKKVDTRTLTQDLKKTGGACSVLANVLEKMQNQAPKDIVDFGNAASDLSHWEDIVGHGAGTP